MRYIAYCEYVVLEPVESAETAVSPDALSANFRQFILDNADAIRAILPQVEALATQAPAQLAPTKPLTATQKRADVIAKARADVAELLTQNHPDVGGEGAWFTSAGGSFITDRCEFVINREKRTVTALLRYIAPGTEDNDKVWRKFTAKAAPDDVFHAEIGKAIALRRALGLTVPDEYINAPKPDKAYNYAKVTYENVVYTITPGVRKERTHGTDEAAPGSYVARYGVIIDDTDVDYSVTAGSAAGTEAAA